MQEESKRYKKKPKYENRSMKLELEIANMFIRKVFPRETVSNIARVE